MYDESGRLIGSDDLSGVVYSLSRSCGSAGKRYVDRREDSPVVYETVIARRITVLTDDLPRVIDPVNLSEKHAGKWHIYRAEDPAGVEIAVPGCGRCTIAAHDLPDVIAPPSQRSE